MELQQKNWLKFPKLSFVNFSVHFTFNYQGERYSFCELLQHLLLKEALCDFAITLESLSLIVNKAHTSAIGFFFCYHKFLIIKIFFREPADIFDGFLYKK